MYENLSTIVSIISSLVAIVSVIWNIKLQVRNNRLQKENNELQKQNNELQKRIVLIEEEREHERKIKSRQANLSAELQRYEKGYKFYLINSGESEAKNIQVNLNGEPLENITARRMVVINGPLPSNIGPNSKISCDVYHFSPGWAPPLEIEIKWDDDYQKNRTYKSRLTL